MDRRRFLICLALRHPWEPMEGFETLNRIPARYNPEDTEPLVRICTRCGRVESRAFTGEWSRMEHLENDGRAVPAQ